MNKKISIEKGAQKTEKRMQPPKDSVSSVWSGVLLFSWLAVRSHIAILPPKLSWRLLTGGSFLAGIGFTMGRCLLRI